jgi:hypothetical protein
MIAAANPGGVLIPVPTAVPPSGSSPIRGSEARSRSTPYWTAAAGDRGGVHQMRAPALDHVGELVGLAGQRQLEVLQRRDQFADDRARRGDVDGRGEDVVGRLRGVHVVVRVHR